MLLREGEASDDTTTATSSDNGESKSRPWSSEANWTVAGGSIDGVITVESLDSPIGSEAVDANDKSPLVLIPPSSDSGPCEIKINFAQKHEVRQVYVRSTARIFEIYLAPSPSSNEYLCTVRCGIAARDDEVLHATRTGEHDGANSNGSAGAQTNGSTGTQAKGRSKDDGNIPANEDDWIEVKVPDSSSQDKQLNSMPRNANHDQEASSQDLYEATAEITDADACISLTLRLLSLQTKEWVYVDEIYVFADPVDSTDTETQVPEVGSSAGTSLMAMLVPTLLNLSRSGNIQKQNKQTFDPKERDESRDVGKHVPHPTFTAIEIQQEEVTDTQQEVIDNAHNSPHLQNPGQAADAGKDAKTDGASNMPYDQIARTLELLLSRVSRIEDICSSFEQSMLKPISSIEGRLQRVEEQVQMLSNNAQRHPAPPCPSTRIASPSFSCTETNAGAINDERSAENVQPQAMPPCPSTRISAPSFSCSGTNSSPFNTEENNYPACGALQSDSPVEVSSNQHVDSSVPVYDTPIIPSLVVTAPEFSCGDDEESDDDFEPKKDCPKEIKKQALSVDDALAAALAGFISATSTSPSRYIQTLAVKAPEFTVDEDGNGNILALPSGQNGQTPPSHYIQTLAIKAPEFTFDEDGDGSVLALPNGQSDQTPPSRYIQTLAIKAPEFTVDEDGDESILALPSGQSGQTPSSRYIQTLTVKAPEFRDGGENTLASPSVPNESDSPRYASDSASSSSSVPVPPVTKQRMADSGDNVLENTLGFVAEKVQFDGEDIRGCSPGIAINCQTTQPELLLAGTDDARNLEATSKGEAPVVSIVSESERSDLPRQFPGLPIEDTCKNVNGSAAETIHEVVEGYEEATSKAEATDATTVSNSDILQQFTGVPIEDTCKTANRSAAENSDDVVKAPEEDISADIIKSSSTSSTVDFEFPILDVKFAPSGLVTAVSPVEALLADVPEKNVEAPHLSQGEVAIVDGIDAQNLLLDWEADYVSDVSAGTEGDGSGKAYACEKEASFSLI